MKDAEDYLEWHHVLILAVSFIAIVSILTFVANYLLNLASGICQ
jgi:hypothetical protein